MDKTNAHQVYKLRSGKVVPGVTTVLNQLGWNKNVLIAWAKKTAMEGKDPDKVRDKAADIGTIAHAMIDSYLKSETLDLGDYSKNDIEKATVAFDSFKRWLDQSNMVYYKSEVQLVNEKYKFGGTIDLITRDKYQEYHLFDFKTSNGIYDEYIVQVAAYKTLWDMMPDANLIKQCHILKLSKEDGSFNHVELSDKQMEWGWKVFTHTLALYKLQKEKNE